MRPQWSVGKCERRWSCWSCAGWHTPLSSRYSKTSPWKPPLEAGKLVSSCMCQLYTGDLNHKKAVSLQSYYSGRLSDKHSISRPRIPWYTSMRMTTHHMWMKYDWNGQGYLHQESNAIHTRDTWATITMANYQSLAMELVCFTHFNEHLFPNRKPLSGPIRVQIKKKHWNTKYEFDKFWMCWNK